MPVAAVVLKYSPRVMVIPVSRCALELTPLGFLIKPSQRFFGSAMVWIKSLLESCLRSFDLFTRAIDYRFSLAAGLGMTLKVASFGESRVAMGACISFCKPFNILDNKRMPPKNTDCENILQLSWRVSSKLPYHFGIFYPLRLINPDAEPIGESCPLIQMPFNPI